MTLYLYKATCKRPQYTSEETTQPHIVQNCQITPPSPRRTQLGVVVYGVLLLNSKHAEEHGMFLNKHYVVPFVKECAVLFYQYKVKNKTP